MVEEFLKDELATMLEMEIGFCGKFVLQKQCDSMNIDLDTNSIDLDNLKELALNIKMAISGFIGERKAKLLYRNILEYRKALLVLDDPRSQPLDRINALVIVGDKRFILNNYSGAEMAYRDAYDIFQDNKCRTNKKIKMRIKRKLARALCYHDDGSEMAIKEYYGVLKIGEKHRYYYDIAISYCGLGWVACKDDDAQLAQEYYGKAIRSIDRMSTNTRLEKNKKVKVKAIIHSGLADVFVNINDPDEAIAWTKSAIEHNMELENYTEVGILYNKMASIFEQKEEYEMAVDGYEQVLTLSHDSGTLLAEGWTLLNLASLLIKEGRLEQAGNYLSRASNILSKFNDCEAQSKLHYMYGEFYQKQRDWENSESHFKTSMENMSKVDSPECLARVQEGLGTLYHLMGQSEKATPLLNSALEWYENSNDVENAKKVTLLIRNSEYVPLGISILRP